MSAPRHALAAPFGAATGTISVSTDHGATWAPVPNTGGVYAGAGRADSRRGCARRQRGVRPGRDAENTARPRRDLFRSTDGGVDLGGARGQLDEDRQPTAMINPNPEQPDVNLLGGAGLVQPAHRRGFPAMPRATRFTWAALLSTAKTANGGANWRLLSNWLAQFGLPYVRRGPSRGRDRSPGARVLFGTDGGLSVSTDGGLSWWSEKNNGLQTFLFHSIRGRARVAERGLGRRAGQRHARPGGALDALQPDDRRRRHGRGLESDQRLLGDGERAGATRSRPARAAISTASPRSRRHGRPSPLPFGVAGDTFVFGPADRGAHGGG